MNTTASDIVTLSWPLWLTGLCWLAIKTAQLFALRVGNEQVRGVLVRLDDAIATAVREVQQVFVERLKAASVGGSLTSEQRTAAKQAALASARTQLGARGLAEVRQAFSIEPDAVDKLLSARIEAAVHQLKAQRQSEPEGGTAGDAVPFGA